MQIENTKQIEENLSQHLICKKNIKKAKKLRDGQWLLEEIMGAIQNCDEIYGFDSYKDYRLAMEIIIDECKERIENSKE